MVKWIGTFSLSLQRLRDAWMTTWRCRPWVKSTDEVSILPWLKKMLKDQQEVRLLWKRTHQKTEKSGILHKWITTKVFPFSDNLITFFLLTQVIWQKTRERDLQVPSREWTSQLLPLKKWRQRIWNYFVRPEARWKIRHSAWAYTSAAWKELSSLKTTLKQWAKDQVTGERSYVDDETSCFWTWDDTECL